jgi:hypothetical protein
VARRAHKRPGHRLEAERIVGARAARGIDVSSNIGQNYPYASESEEERAAQIARVFTANEGLADKVRTEAIALPQERRWWVWKCPTTGCSGLLHSAGYARNARAVYTVCDTCGQTRLR